MSKSEERLKRQLERIAKKVCKNARLAQSVVIDSKYIRPSTTPDLNKNAVSQSPDNYKNCLFAWCTDHSDVEGFWSWREPRAWAEAEFESSIKSTLDGHVSNSWLEVEAKRYNGAGNYRKLLNKYQPLDSLAKEAQDRWHDLEHLNEFEELFRLRVGTNRRIWGIRILHHFFVVWYERNHRICPVPV